jgi:DNA-binding NtrC family response regulator
MPSLDLRTENGKNTKHSPECVLLIDAEATDAARILEELGSSTGERLDVEWVPELSSGLGRLRKGGVGTVVFDMTSPGSRGIENFDRLFQAAPGVPILILVGADAEEMARKAVQHGARDYLVKNPADGYRLRHAVRAMMERRSTAAVLL